MTAYADDDEDRDESAAQFGSTIGSTLVGIGLGLITNVTFTIHDVWLIGKNERQGIGWGIAESALTLPQSAYMNYHLARKHRLSRTEKLMNTDKVVLFPAIWSTQLLTHGVWSLISDRTAPGELYGLSWAFGANLTFTSALLGGAVGKRWGGNILGAFEIVGTVPTIAVSVFRAVATEPPYQGAWIALAAWSGVLFGHGLVSTILKVPAKEAPSTTTSKLDAVRLGPTVLSDGVSRVPGIMVWGAY